MIPREWVKGLSAKHEEILKAEEHHTHEIIKMDNKFYWKVVPEVNELKKKIGLTNMVEMLDLLDLDRNSEPYRKLYRDIGYSLDGYWKLFYWEANNPDSDKYRRIKHDVITKSYGYWLGIDGSLYGLTAGDHYFEDTGIKFSEYDMKSALENLEAFREQEIQKEIK